MAVLVKEFGRDKSGEAACLVTIKNNNGMTISATTMGASLVSIFMKDKNGKEVDVILGYDSAEEYQENGGCLGAVLGRSANRIANASFVLGGKEYHLPQNNNENNSHSGPDGFHKRNWKIGEVTENSMQFLMKDADMQQGYAGNFEASVTYDLDDDGTLEIRYQATCDQDTLYNMTNHVYFNLRGHDSGDILGTQLKMSAAYYTPIHDGKCIPTGEIAPVEGTPMDFTQWKTIGQDIDADFDQIRYTGGYDHNYVIKSDKGEMELFAQAYDPQSGIMLEASTDLPGVQFYTANGFKEGRKGKGGVTYHCHQGFCLETQYYPNSINQDGFPKPILKAGEKGETITRYRLSVR